MICKGETVLAYEYKVTFLNPIYDRKGDNKDELIKYAKETNKLCKPEALWKYDRTEERYKKIGIFQKAR
jgi:hypothetical protein